MIEVHFEPHIPATASTSDLETDIERAQAERLNLPPSIPAISEVLPLSITKNTDDLPNIWQHSSTKMNSAVTKKNSTQKRKKEKIPNKERAEKRKAKSTGKKLGRKGIKTSKKSPRFWLPEEQAVLLKAVEKFRRKDNKIDWSRVASFVTQNFHGTKEGRTQKECSQRFERVSNPKLKKGKWSKEEDDQLRQAVRDQLANSEGNQNIRWHEIMKKVPTRSGKQCRERWLNYLSPSVERRKEWTREEETLLLKLAGKYPRKWAQIARAMEGRTENMVKVKYNSLVNKSKSKTKVKVKVKSKTKAPKSPTKKKSFGKFKGEPSQPRKRKLSSHCREEDRKAPVHTKNGATLKNDSLNVGYKIREFEKYVKQEDHQDQILFSSFAAYPGIDHDNFQSLLYSDPKKSRWEEEPLMEKPPEHEQQLGWDSSVDIPNVSLQFPSGDYSEKEICALDTL
mmetsp:Transcript_10347/g.11884  ORF Transcript_10347/g.11884 Transcript_10347/m.11884 type:complete len:452 (+) Transcript_10347:108-1463(+)